MGPFALYSLAAIKTLSNVASATSIVPTGNAQDTLQIPVGQANAIRYWLHLAGVVTTVALGSTLSFQAKIGSIIVCDTDNADLVSSNPNMFVLDCWFTVLPASTVARGARLFIDDGANNIVDLTSYAPKTASAAISANSLTVTVQMPSGADPAATVVLTDFQLVQMNF